MRNLRLLARVRLRPDVQRWPVLDRGRAHDEPDLDRSRWRHLHQRRGPRWRRRGRRQLQHRRARRRGRRRRDADHRGDPRADVLGRHRARGRRREHVHQLRQQRRQRNSVSWRWRPWRSERRQRGLRVELRLQLHERFWLGWRRRRLDCVRQPRRERRRWRLRGLREPQHGDEHGRRGWRYGRRRRGRLDEPLGWLSRRRRAERVRDRGPSGHERRRRARDHHLPLSRLAAAPRATAPAAAPRARHVLVAAVAERPGRHLD